MKIIFILAAISSLAWTSHASAAPTEWRGPFKIMAVNQACTDAGIQAGWSGLSRVRKDGKNMGFSMFFTAYAEGYKVKNPSKRKFKPATAALVAGWPKNIKKAKIKIRSMSPKTPGSSTDILITEVDIKELFGGKGCVGRVLFHGVRQR